MSDSSQAAPRPVSLVATLAVLALLSLFWVLAQRAYLHHRSAAPQNEHADNLSKDLDWKATPESRRAALAKLREAQAAQGASYGWVDRKAGIVQVPIARAEELVIAEHGGSK